MADAPAAPRWLAWIPLVTAAGLIIGGLLAFGGYIAQGREHERRITALERRDEQLQLINDRTTRIEAKLEVLTPPAAARVP